jgi:hypothetical protein
MIPMLLIAAATPLTVFGPVFLAIWAYRHGRPEYLLYAVMGVAVYAFWLWMGATGRSRTLQKALTDRIYAAEGEVAPEPLPAVRSSKRLIAGMLIAVALGLVLAARVAVGMSVHYVQPLVALFLVPYMIYAQYRTERFAAPLMYAIPALYALHAVAVLAGAPLPCSDSWLGGVCAPLFAYAVIAVVASHAYSRYALRRLRRLAKVPGDSVTGEQTQ